MMVAAVELAQAAESPAQKLNVLREYVQACALRSLHECEAFDKMAFVGGTALRFLYNLPRFSEDLDFSLHSADGYEPLHWLEKMKRDLRAAGFDASVQWNDRKTLHVGWLHFAGLLKKAGLSAHAEQKLSIKLEVDTRPPEGAECEVTLVNRHMLFAVRHYNIPSLMAGKIHALITRSYPKGRDWYDLLWYGTQRPSVEPNLALLQNALDQSQGGGRVDAELWRKHVVTRLNELDEEALRRDVESFLERQKDARFLTKRHWLSLLNAS